MKTKPNSPQKEQGYVAINNENLDYLITQDFSGREFRIILAIIRKTWGYNKKKDEISYSQLSRMTNISKGSISTILKGLIKKNVIKCEGNNPKTYWFNKIYADWDFIIKDYGAGARKKKGVSELKPVAKVVSKLKRGFQNYNKGVSELHKKSSRTETTIYNNTKDIYTKDNIIDLCNLFKEINPSYEILPKIKKERESLYRLLNQYGYEEVENRIKMLPKIVVQPYAPRVTTPYELEMGMGKIKIFLEQEKNKTAKHSVTKL